MPRQENISMGIYIAIMLGAIGATVALVCWLASETCERRWAESGRVARWEFGAGCRVVVDNRMVPERAVRVMPGD